MPAQKAIEYIISGDAAGEESVLLKDRESVERLADRLYQADCPGILPANPEELSHEDAKEYVLLIEMIDNDNGYVPELDRAWGEGILPRHISFLTQHLLTLVREPNCDDIAYDTLDDVFSTAQHLYDRYDENYFVEGFSNGFYATAYRASLKADKTLLKLLQDCAFKLDENYSVGLVQDLSNAVTEGIGDAAKPIPSPRPDVDFIVENPLPGFGHPRRRDYRNVDFSAITAAVAGRRAPQ